MKFKDEINFNLRSILFLFLKFPSVKKSIGFVFIFTFLFANYSIGSSLSPAKFGKNHSNDSILRIYENLDLISELIADHGDQPRPIFDNTRIPPVTVEGRLQSIQKEIPLTYNSYVQQFIDKYSQSSYLSYLAKMQGLGEYYFEIYDRIFDEVGLPNHIKYLSIVESALNPHAVSKAGATGPWQFMYATAKVYGLKIDNNEDQRKDPIASSYAAAEYLLKAFEQFSDWHLAIAAYNCGPGNVERAIKKSGLDNPGFWEIRNFLPKETQNYVPSFIAMTYMMEYFSEENTPKILSSLAPKTEVINVKQNVDLKDVANALGTDLESIKALNPSYKKGIVFAKWDDPRRLILPTVSPDKFQHLYAVLYEENSDSKKTELLQYAANQEPFEENIKSESRNHRVKKGENLGMIAKRFQVSVQDLKAWNGLKNNSIQVGQVLSVESSSQKGKHPSKSNSSIQQAYYIVKKGDSLSSIATAHKGVSVESLKKTNGLKNNQIKPGMKLKLI